MLMNSGYLNNSHIDFKDKSRPLIVGSCGIYKLHSRPKLPTWRPHGRVDYQLLYVASGIAHFFFDGKDTIVTAGHMVLYRPKEEQKYIYYGKDQTEVYWVHFTGSEVKQILKDYHFPSEGHVVYTGNSPEYHRIYRKMIWELQLCRPHFEEMLSMLLHQLFILISRETADGHKVNPHTQNELEQALRYFNQNYNKEINIDDYAASRHMSTCWFIRCFKQYNGITPMQYILSLRISNAQYLLDNTSYNVSEIASIVGYDNPLYFSRLFRKQTGLSPSEYRKRQMIQ